MESLGLELGKFVLGEFFVVLLLSGLIGAPVTAVAVDTLRDRIGYEYGGPADICVGLLCGFVLWILPAAVLFSWIAG